MIHLVKVTAIDDDIVLACTCQTNIYRMEDGYVEHDAGCSLRLLSKMAQTFRSYTHVNMALIGEIRHTALK